MFEARLILGGLLKKVVEAIKDLVTDANFECTETGLGLQAMDTSHVALVALKLMADGFEHFRCDRDVNLGMNLASMAKMLKCADVDDIITISAKDEDNKVAFLIESKDQSRVSDFQLMLLEIDSEHLGIPDAVYEATILMPSAELQRIIRDLASFGDSVTITATKEGIRFSTTGDIGAAVITCKHNTATEKEEDQVVVQLTEPVTLSFSLRYFASFTKATALSHKVIISMSKDLPVVVEYPIADMGHLKFYLAPKIDEEDEMED